MKLLGKIEAIVIIIAFMVDTAAVIFQVFNRNLFHLNVPWSEELARFLTIWVALIGSAYAFRMKRHIWVDAIVSKYSKKGKFVAGIISDLLIIAFSATIVFLSVGVISMMIQSGQKSASLRIIMGYVYLAIPIGFTLTVVEVIKVMLDDIKAYKTDKGETK